MSQKSAKKKTKKATRASADPSVLGSLRSTRPTRLGGDRRVSAKPAAAASTATATKPKASKPRPAKKVAPKPAAKAAPKPAPKVPTPPPTEHPSGPPRGPEIVTTAVQAAGELAQIGAGLGGRLIKRAAKRIPRP
jgi:hypothetical protein